MATFSIGFKFGVNYELSSHRLGVDLIYMWVLDVGREAMLRLVFTP